MGHIYVKAAFYNAVDYVQYVEGKRRLEEVAGLIVISGFDAHEMVDRCREHQSIQFKP
ncbi:MAG: hypothetical protein QXU64_05505 [Thermofilaceae archaeon]